MNVAIVISNCRGREMLFEKITYQDDFPININIANIDEYPLHYHQDIEFVYVLKGEVSLKNGYCYYTLKEGDIFTNAGHEVHSLMSTGKDNVVALIQISTRHFSQYFPTLSKSCYRTYSNNPTSKKHDNLREKLLQILLQYSIKSFNYKSECTYLMVDVIKLLEKFFNLFAFEGNVVINFESSDLITVERISRIINYIYQYYAQRITLEDLAEIEHLSTFYLSHIIKNCTGMNFRDFLCFARVEWSEIELLDTNKKISQVARDVGFSTTAYYEKHFEKWFKRTPAEHRAHFMPFVKSDPHPASIEPIPVNRTIMLIKNTLSSLNSQKNHASVVNCLDLELNIDTHAKPITTIDHHLDVQVSYEDFCEMGCNLLNPLKSLSPSRVTVLFSDDSQFEKAEDFTDALKKSGLCAETKKYAGSVRTQSYGNDSIAYPIYIFNRLLRSNEHWVHLRFRDPGNADPIIKGLTPAITSCGIKKPVFYAYQVLSMVKGDIICWGKQYCVVRTCSPCPTYVMVVTNFNDDIYSLCAQESTLHQVRNTLNEFKDEINYNVSLNLEPGMYSVMKYTFTKDRNIFAYMSALDFTDEPGALGPAPSLISTEPDLDIYMDDVRTTFNINFTLKGAGIQLAVVRPKKAAKQTAL